MRVTAIIQARMGSTRLPGKVLKNIKGKTVLSHVIERVKQAESVDEIIIATSDKQQDEPIMEEALSNDVKIFRGSEKDVLSRYYLAAKENRAETIIRITSDCPVIDPKVIDEIVNFYEESEHDIVTNAGSEPDTRTYPRGLDTEVFSFRALENSYMNAKEHYQREHVTPYIYENANSVYYYKGKKDLSHFRWTLDTIEDFRLINEIYNYLYQGKHNFYLNEIINLFKEHPELYEINQHIEQKKIK